MSTQKKTKQSKANKQLPDVISVPQAKRLLPLDFSDLFLKPKEYKYVAVYCTNGFKGIEAAAAAGFSSSSRNILRSKSYDLQRRPQVIEAIRRFVDGIIGPYKERLEFDILTRYYHRATYLITDFYYEDGQIKPLDEIEEHNIECIDAIETKYYGTNGERKVITYKLPNRDAALQMLYKMITGNDLNNNNTLLPEDARKKLSKIWDEYAETKEVTARKVTVEEIAVTQKKKAKKGKKKHNTKVDKLARTKLPGVDI